MLKHVQLADLAEIDRGRLAAAFDIEMRRLMLDIEDRPAEKKARKLVIALAITPDLDAEGTLDGVNCEVGIDSDVPARKSRTYSFAIGDDGQALYEPVSPSDHRQPGLPLDSPPSAPESEQP